MMALCVCFVATLFSVSVLAILHEGHNCAFVKRCAICVHIQDTQSLLKRLLFMLASCGLLFVGASRLAREQGEAALVMETGTPVAFKVRMNN